MNPSKCRSIVFSLKHDKRPVHSPLFLDNVCIEEVEKYTHLGLVFQNNMLHGRVTYKILLKLCVVQI
jgi:hypothetical protein